MRFKTLVICAVGFVFLTMYAHASKKHILPDACGDNGVEFEVNKITDVPNAPPLSEDRARVYFIEAYDKHFGMRSIVTRFAVDSKWVGAAKNNNYFFVDLPAGNHKLCSSVKDQDQMVGMQNITVEPGKTYYWEAKYDLILGPVRALPTANGTTTITRTNTMESGFTLLDDDAGKYRIKAFDFVGSTPKP